MMERLIVTPCFSMEPDLFDIIAQISEECADEVSGRRDVLAFTQAEPADAQAAARCPGR